MALVLLLGVIIPTAAETGSGEFEIFYNKGDIAGSTVVYGVASGYVLTIEPNVMLNPDKTQAVTVNDMVKLSQVHLARAKQVSVSISSVNYANGWQVVLSDNNAVKVEYSIMDGNTALANNSTVLTCAGGTEGASKALSFQVVGTAGMGGNYTDTLTFTAAVQDK